jgi:hypothetical protein
LEGYGPQVCKEKLGSRARKHLYRLFVSKKEDPELRKNAIEALFLIGIDESFAKDHPGLGLKELDTDLKNIFYSFSFSDKTDKGTKNSIIALLESPQEELREEVKNRIFSSNDPDMNSLMEQKIGNRAFGEELRAQSATLLAAKQAPNASRVLLAALKEADPDFNVALVDRLVDGLVKLNVSGPEIENVLIKKFQELGINDLMSSAFRSNHRRDYEEAWGWNPDPCKRIITALTLVGEKKALGAMIKVFLEKKEDVLLNYMNLKNPDLSTGLTSLQSIDMLPLVDGIVKLFRRLNELGELPSMDHIERTDIMKALLEKIEKEP